LLKDWLGIAPDRVYLNFSEIEAGTGAGTIAVLGDPDGTSRTKVFHGVA
jgi:hypothetical protein